MSKVRIYQPGTYQTGQFLALSVEASHHVGVVLRMEPGESLTLFCGDNREFDAVIETIKKKQVTVAVGAVQDKNRESPLCLHLAQAISKGDRMEWVMQKAVELGVASITPLITDRCVVKLNRERMEKKMQQWQAIVVGACEQSGRNIVPVVYPPVALEHYTQQIRVEAGFILYPEAVKTWRDYTVKFPSIALVIGPEGGLSEAEIEAALAQGFKPLSLGPRVLRTETAAITALSLLQALGGDL